MLRSSDVLTSVQKCRKFGAVVVMGNERVGFEYCGKSFADVAGLVRLLSSSFSPLPG